MGFWSDSALNSGSSVASRAGSSSRSTGSRSASSAGGRSVLVVVEGGEGLCDGVGDGGGERRDGGVDERLGEEPLVDVGDIHDAILRIIIIIIIKNKRERG